MFLTIREYFRSRGSKTHAGRLVRLFLFEFAIVVLGVLVAQMQQASFERTARVEDGRDVAASVRGAVQHYNAIAEVGERSAACFEARLDELATINRAGARVSADALGQPALRGINEFRFAPSDYRAARLAEGDAFVAQARGVADRLETNDALGAQIAQQWLKVRLLDPEHGVLRDDDRRAIRDALIAVKADWASLRQFYASNQALALEWGLAAEPLSRSPLA